MTLKITHKHGTTASTPPVAGDIDVGEIAINSADAELFTKDTAGAVHVFISKFTQSGTGAVPRTIASKLSDAAVSVKDFGAKGDGVTDDTVAIQAAIDANQNQTVFFPKGAYKISSQGTVELGAYASGETSENIAYCLKTKAKRTKLKGDNAVLKSDWNGTPSLNAPIGIVSDAGNEEHVFEGLTFQNLQFGIANVKRYVDTQSYAVLCQYKDLVFDNVGIGIYALAFERCTFDFIQGKNSTLCVIAQGGIWNSTSNTQIDNSGFVDKCTLNFISNFGPSAGSVTSNSAAFDTWFDDHFFKTANNSLLSPSGAGPATAYPYQGISGRTIYAMARYSRPQANNVLNLMSHMNLHRGALCFETGVANTVSGIYTENVGYADAQGRSQPIGGSATDPYLGAGVRLPYIIQGSTVESAEFQFTYAARVFGDNVRNFERPTLTGCDVTVSQTQTYREGTLLASGGINFGTPSGDATIKTIKDYEEGTWSPVWTFTGGASLTTDVVSADYIKIGRQVTVIAQIRTDGTATSSGDARLTGLPFVPSSYGSASLSAVNSWATDLVNLKAFAHPESYIRFLTNPSTGTNSELQRSDFADGDNKNSIYLTLTYFTAS